MKVLDLRVMTKGFGNHHVHLSVINKIQAIRIKKKIDVSHDKQRIRGLKNDRERYRPTNEEKHANKK